MVGLDGKQHSRESGLLLNDLDAVIVPIRDAVK